MGWPRLGETAAKADDAAVANAWSSARAKWVVRISPQVADATARLTSLTRTKREQQHRVVQCYITFCRVNDLLPWTSRSLYAVVGAMEAASLAASTIDTYVTHLVAAEQERHLSAARIALLDIRRITSLRRAEHRGKHAKDFQGFSDALRYATALGGERRRAALAMLVLGLRRKDLTRTACADVRFFVGGPRPRIVFDLRVSKGIRKANNKRRITLTDMLSGIPREMLDELARTFEPEDSEVAPFADLTHFKVPDGYTPASFRRNFVHRALALHTDCNGVMDLAAVCTQTAHLNTKTLEAFYLPDLRVLAE